MTTVRRLTEKRAQPESPSSDGTAAVAANRRPRFLERAVAKWHAAINLLVPLGYEDEFGFHYGKSPDRNHPGEATAA